ncbi:MAG: thiolase domain-containing protein [Acidobacteriota bacterium]
MNQPELVHEAVARPRRRRDHLGDVDAVVHGNMELFEMVHQPDMWHTLGTGAAGRAALRVTTGGTTGTTVVCAADTLVASGLHDVVLAVGFEKLQEGHTTGGITNMADPLWGRSLQTGALTGATAEAVIREFGADRARRAAMKLRILMDRNAAKNPLAHRSFGLDESQAENLMTTSPPLVGELRLIHMCSQSDGACALVFASEERARRMKKPPVWVRDHVTVHREESFNMFAMDLSELEETTHRYAARTLFERNGITDPLAYFDVFEMYDPSSWWGLAWLRDFLLLEGDAHLRLVEDDALAIDGKLPMNPSGGVVSTNPIGATAMIRVAEAALQIRGDAGAHQVPGDVRHALASGFGGTFWTVLVMLEKELGS